jgi:DNA-binding NarL/FixJ family response regulator/Tfp pilus assembly protein PilZ
VPAIPPLLRAELDRFAARHKLTNREHDVLFLLVTGIGTVPDIAEQLELSQNTVHNHFKNMFRRTGTNTKSALIGLFVKEAMERQVAAEAFFRRPRVLVLDPDPHERDRIAEALREHGLHAVTEADSTRVLERIAAERVDIVVADVSLPGAVGRGVLDDVRSRLGKHPVVLLTAPQQDQSRSEWRARGAGDVIEKPWDADRLVFTVMEHFADSPYERSRLLRVETDIRGRVEATDVALTNVGFGGAFLALHERALRAPEQLAIGTRVQIAFALEEPEPIQVQGEVRWRRASKRPGTDAGVGVQFVDVSDVTRTRIEAFVRKQKLQGFVPLAQERLALSRMIAP